MYFKDRAAAGRLLAKELKKYKRDNVAIVSLSPGGVIVGAQVAMELHASLMLMLTENISLPGEPDAIAAMSSTGTFAFNNMLSAGQIEEYVSEFHGYLDQQRMEKLHRLNVLVGREGEIHKEYLRHHVIILVSDGLLNGFSLDIAYEYLKTVKYNKLIVAVPFASVAAVDRMHLVGDEIYCLDVKEDYFSTNHYYDDNTIPELDDLFKVVEYISLNWHREKSKSSRAKAQPRSD